MTLVQRFTNYSHHAGLPGVHESGTNGMIRRRHAGTSRLASQTVNMCCLQLADTWRKSKGTTWYGVEKLGRG